MRNAELKFFLALLISSFNSQAEVDPIVKLSCDKKIVILAELPSHGEAKTFETKAEIVKKLVQECGFNKIHFEAPIYEFIELQQLLKNNRSKVKNLDDALGGFWVPKELDGWRGWLFDQAKAGHVIVTGLDDQISASSHQTRIKLPSIFKKHLSKKEYEHCQTILKRDLFWLYDDKHPYSSAAQQDLLQCIQKVKSLVIQNKIPETKMSTQNVILKNLENLYLRTSGSDLMKSRDHSMYENFKWHTKKQDKHIIWTATVHAAKKPFKEGHTPLGTYLNNDYNKQLAVIGFTAYSGMSSMAGNKPQPLKPAPTGSLEATILQTSDDIMYLNRDALKEKKLSSSRLHGSFSQENWHQLYDGVVIFRKELAPTFIAN